MDEELPPELQAMMESDRRSGLGFRLDWRTPGRRSAVKEIHWRRTMFGKPTDPNALAEAIIKNVTAVPMVLDLDGHRYVIMTEEKKEAL